MMMRSLLVGAAGVAALSIAGPAFANGIPPAIPDSVTPFVPNDKDVEVVPQVVPGDQIAIACDAIANKSADSDVRVVLTISAIPTEPSPGYKKVLATDEQIAFGAVRVRIPKVPEIADHTVNLDVYVVNAKGSETCDAGHLKITDDQTSGSSKKTDREHS